MEKERRKSYKPKSHRDKEENQFYREVYRAAAQDYRRAQYEESINAVASGYSEPHQEVEQEVMAVEKAGGSQNTAAGARGAYVGPLHTREQYEENRGECIRLNKYDNYRYYVCHQPFLQSDLAGKGRLHRVVKHPRNTCNLPGFHGNMPEHYHVIVEWDKEYLERQLARKHNVLTKSMAEYRIERDTGTNKFRDEEHWYNHNKYLDHYEVKEDSDEDSLPMSDSEDVEPPSKKQKSKIDFYKQIHPQVPFLTKEEWFEAYNKYAEKQGKPIFEPGVQEERNSSWSYIMATRKNIEQAQYDKPLESKNWYYLLRHDPSHERNMKIILRIMELIHIKREKHKKTPIVWLCGAASAGKTVFASIAAKALGKDANIDGNSAWQDKLILDTAARQNVDTIVMEEYCLDEDKKNTLTKQFQFLKQITTGMEHEVRTAKTGKDKASQHYIKLKALFICTNWDIDTVVRKIGADAGVNNRSCIMNFPGAIKVEHRWDEKQRNIFQAYYVRIARKYLKDRIEGITPDSEAQPPSFPRKYLEQYKNWTVAITGLPDLRREENDDYSSSEDEDEYVDWQES